MMYKQFLGYATTWGLFVWIQCLGYAKSIFRHIISTHLRHDASMTTNVVLWYLQGTRVQATINSYHVTKFKPRIHETGIYIIRKQGYFVFIIF